MYVYISLVLNSASKCCMNYPPEPNFMLPIIPTDKRVRNTLKKKKTSTET